MDTKERQDLYQAGLSRPIFKNLGLFVFVVQKTQKAQNFRISGYLPFQIKIFTFSSQNL